MSYDVYIGDQSFNYTYNVGKLFHDHMPGSILGLDGLTGKQAAQIISDAFNAIHSTVLGHWSDEVIGEPKFCALYDSPNGWGSTVGALVFLAQIMGACAKHPRHKVRVS